MKPRLFLLIICLYRFFIVFSTDPARDSILILINEYQYEKALDLINKEIDKNNNPKVLYFYKGNILREMYAYSDAIDSYLKAYKYDTTDNIILIKLASTYQDSKNYYQSIEYFKRALSNDPGNRYLSLQIALCKYLNESYRAAKKDFIELYRSDSLNYFVLTRLASCYNRIQQPDSAVIYFDKAYLLNPADVNNLKNLSISCIGAKDYDLGIKRTEEFISRDSNSSEINSMNAYLYLQDKQYQKSIAKYRHCLDRNFISFENYKYLGVAYYRIKDYDNAKTYFEKAYFIDSLDVNNLEFLSSACLNSYYKELGIFYYEKFMELSGYDIEKYAEIYMKLYSACRSWAYCPPEKLIPVSLTAYQLNPDKHYILYNIGHDYDALKKDSAKAIEYYGRFLEAAVDEPGFGFLNDEVEKRIKELEQN